MSAVFFFGLGCSGMRSPITGLGEGLKLPLQYVKEENINMQATEKKTLSFYVISISS